MNPKYVEINDSFYSSILIVNYYREQNDLLLKNLIDSNINLNISIFYEKQDPYKIIKDLTYHIGNVGAEIKGKENSNREDIEIASFTYNDAKYIRREIQVNNEDIYYLYIYITTSAKTKEELEYNLNKIEGLIESRGMQARRANFRQEEAFISTLPFFQNPKEIKEVSKRNVLTSSLISTYPFISSSVFDEEGIFIGTNMYNNSLVFIDRFDRTKYKNGNMCVFGTSGAGKSFYIKLMALRNRIFGIEQYIIDPDREYTKLCKQVEGTLIKIGPSSNTYINIFDIRKESLEEGTKGYLASKIPKLIGFFNLILGNIDEEEKAIIEEKIIEVYKSKGITFDDKSLYKKHSKKLQIEPEFKSPEDMPTLGDFYKLYKNIKLKPFVDGSMRFFNNKTNVDFNNKLVVADIYELGDENIKYGMYIFTELFWDKIKEDRTVRKSIYLDEIWRLIGATSNKEVASFVYKIFKTIRKYGGSGVAITQDVSDLFSLDNGTYGKAILNNSSIKSFFSLEEENIRLLSNFINLSEKEKIEIKALKKGEALMFASDNHILINIDSSREEKEIIE